MLPYQLPGLVLAQAWNDASYSLRYIGTRDLESGSNHSNRDCSDIFWAPAGRDEADLVSESANHVAIGSDISLARRTGCGLLRTTNLHLFSIPVRERTVDSGKYHIRVCGTGYQEQCGYDPGSPIEYWASH